MERDNKVKLSYELLLTSIHSLSELVKSGRDNNVEYHLDRIEKECREFRKHVEQDLVNDQDSKKLIGPFKKH